jgi:hypothetical protein
MSDLTLVEAPHPERGSKATARRAAVIFFLSIKSINSGSTVSSTNILYFHHVDLFFNRMEGI